ncbi:MAG: HAMP domain-containing sensor histidine kinase [Myxococcota bacterium]
MDRRGVSLPIALTVGLVTLAIALTAGWQILVVREFAAFVEGFTAVHWMLVILGSLFFVTIITVAILQAVWLVREIRTNQRQQNFLDAVTHELHTPLTSLRLYVDTLQGKSLDEGQRGEFLEIMSDDIDRLQRTIDQLLSAAGTDARRNRRTPIDLRRLLGECVQDARERHGLDEGALQLEVPAFARVRGDLEQLRVAFRNLIENAIHYAGEKTRVTVRVRPASGRKLEVEVEDQGIGLPESALGRVFQRFQRLSQEAVRGPSGLGLGLYIVRNVVRGHGGSVRAESDGEGKGSRFIVTLPGQLDGSIHSAR